jgi:TIR domain-containing protein
MNAEPKVFISYRRQETAAYAGRLYDAMTERFGESNVFMDVDMKPGVDFVERISQGVGACEALIAVIGPSWATVTDGEGGVRLADPEDFVRLEVETALRRPDVTLIPVLVSGARMPDPGDLPTGLRPITRRNALELSDGRWRYDVGRLNDTLDEVIGGVAAAPAPTVPRERSLPRLPTWRLIGEGVVVAGLAALVARWLVNDNKFSIGSDNARFIANVIQNRAVSWAVAGVALGIWLAFRVRAVHDYARCAVLGLLVGAIAGALGGAIFAFPVAYGDLDTSTVNLINLASFAVAGALIGALIGGLWLPPRVAAGLVSGGVAAAIAVAPFVAGDTKEWVFCLNAAAIAGVTLATLVASDARRPATRRRAGARSEP